MTPLDIKFALQKINIRQKDIALKAGVDQSTVNKVIKGKTISKPIAKVIAQELGKQVTEVFDDSQYSEAA